MTLIDVIKPYARAAKYARLYRRAVRDAARAEAQTQEPATAPITFIVACGRSGTTILGKIFARHPQVRYLFEPYHLWAAIDPRCDMLNLYVQRDDAHCILDAADARDAAIRRRFDALIGSAGIDARTIATIEKTPINAMRLGYIDALAPGCSIVHIVRDGVDVARSIDRLASGNIYRIAGKPALNQWWGVNDCKWRFLRRDGIARGYWADEVDAISTNAQRGAYEWLVSLSEVDRHREIMGSRLLEFSYESLTVGPAATLRRLCEHIGIEADASWLDAAAAEVTDARRNEGLPLELPPRMAEAFNTFQARYGFSGRARASERPAEVY